MNANYLTIGPRRVRYYLNFEQAIGLAVRKHIMRGNGIHHATAIAGDDEDALVYTVNELVENALRAETEGTSRSALARMYRASPASSSSHAIPAALIPRLRGVRRSVHAAVY